MELRRFVKDFLLMDGFVVDWFMRFFSTRSSMEFAILSIGLTVGDAICVGSTFESTLWRSLVVASIDGRTEY